MTELALTTLEPLILPPEEAIRFEWLTIKADDDLLRPHKNFFWHKISTLLKRSAYPIYERVECNKFKFVFRYDEDDSELLHISVKHSTTPTEAIEVFLKTEPTWNKKLKYFENRSETYGLYWFWQNQQKKIVMVVACFEL